MASKYYAFWEERSNEISHGLEAAVQGLVVEIDVSGIRVLGRRKSWSGKARVQGRAVLDAPMAHAMALARLVTERGFCDSWERVEFTLTISANCMLRVSADSGASAVLPSRATHKIPPIAKTGSPPVQARTEQSLDAAERCCDVHRLLLSLPLMQVPDEVSFSNGLYFFYEEGEESQHALDGRIVRVGNHPRKDGRLKARLREHFRSSRNAKNGSVFRKHLGGAIIRRKNPGSSCLAPAPGKGHWERQDGKSCPECAPTEDRITRYLNQKMRFRCVHIPDQLDRNSFEAALIATLSNCMDCRPSERWLGNFAYGEKVRTSGMWNSEFVGGETIAELDVRRFANLVALTVDGVNAEKQTRKREMATQMIDRGNSRSKPMVDSINDVRRKPIVVIQCASAKNPRAMEFALEGRRVKFVARSELAPSTGEALYFRPDDRHPGGKGTWRDLVTQANSGEQGRSQFITAGRLYRNAAYGKLLEVFGERHLYILSAGWGLVRASYQLPDYDITLRNMKKEEKYKQRLSKDSYLDFNHLLDDYGDNCESPIYFFGGNHYRPLFASLMDGVKASKSIFFRTPRTTDVETDPFGFYSAEHGFHNLPFPTDRRTNWHYQCAEAFADHYRRLN